MNYPGGKNNNQTSLSTLTKKANSAFGGKIQWHCLLFMDTIIIVLSLWQSDANQHDSDDVTFDLHNGIVLLYFMFLIIHVPWVTEIVFWDTCIKKYTLFLLSLFCTIYCLQQQKNKNKKHPRTSFLSNQLSDCGLFTSTTFTVFMMGHL